MTSMDRWERVLSHPATYGLNSKILALMLHGTYIGEIQNLSGFKLIPDALSRIQSQSMSPPRKYTGVWKSSSLPYPG